MLSTPRATENRVQPMSPWKHPTRRRPARDASTDESTISNGDGDGPAAAATRRANDDAKTAAATATARRWKTGRSATSWSHRADDAVESVPTDDADDDFRRRPTAAARRLTDDGQRGAARPRRLRVPHCGMSGDIRSITTRLAGPPGGSLPSRRSTRSSTEQSSVR